MLERRNHLAKMLLRSPLRPASLRNVPLVGGWIHGLSHRLISPDEKVWAQICQGPAKGLWLELNPRTGQDLIEGRGEAAVQKALCEILRPGMVFYDLGANVGLFTLLAARLVGGNGKVFSFEPDSPTAVRLRRHVERNGFAHVTVIEAGAWSSTGKTNFLPADSRSPDRGVGRFCADSTGREGIMLDCYALDDFARKAPLPDVIKCDVEGAEWEVFRGATSVLCSQRPRIICEVHSRDKGEALARLLKGFGYIIHPLDATHILGLPARNGQEARAIPMALGEGEVWALRGRLEHPTDGVQDYCTRLTEALGRRGVNVKCVELEWERLGWLKALRDLRRQFLAQRAKWILLQYTALAWSRRGFPFAAVAAVWMLQRRGARIAVVFHEPRGLAGPRLIDRLRCACQGWTVKKLHALALKSIFTIPIRQISWLAENDAKAEFIPIGANVPECFAQPPVEGPVGDAVKTVAVFCLSRGANGRREAAEIVHVARFITQKGMRIRLSILGKNSAETGKIVKEELAELLEVQVHGPLPAEVISQALSAAHAYLYVYGMVSQRRGSALAGVACGSAMVGYAGAALGTPIAEAGLLLVPFGDRQALAEALWRVLSDDALREELQRRSRSAQQRYFSWDVIAGQFVQALGGLGQVRAE